MEVCMTLILRLLLKAAPLIFFFLAARALKEMLRASQYGRGAGSEGAPPYGKDFPGAGGSSGRRGKDPYEVLGCAPSSSNEEIKSKYRELLGKYHPDRFIGQKLDEEFIQLASRKFQEIQEAYEKIRRVRKF
jgi:DnaJ-domain-containing protein 1